MELLNHYNLDFVFGYLHYGTDEFHVTDVEINILWTFNFTKIYVLS